MEKDKSEQADIEFHSTEEKLKSEDIKIQDSMIRFSIFLQNNLMQQERHKNTANEEEIRIK